MKRSRALTFVALTSALALAACAGDGGGGGIGGGTGGGNPPDVYDLKPGVITGIVYDTDGEPIPNARVEIDAALGSSNVITQTDAQGIYWVEGLPLVPYYVHAWHHVDFEGTDFCLRLGMSSVADYDAVTPTNGVVRNFEWQLTGPIPDFVSDPEYFGGKIWLDLQGDFSGTEVELTFTPTSTLLDGSTAETLTRTFDPAVDDYVIEDLPVANYTVSGVIRANGSETPLHIGLTPADTYAEQTASADLAFEPGDNQCISYASGVSPASLFLNSNVDWQY